VSQTAVKVVRLAASVLAGNDEQAARNRARLDAAGVLAVNLVAGPGAGKTSLIEATLAGLQGRARVGVIEGDLAGSVDAERVLRAGAAEALQINTEGGCHLEAAMVARALDDLDLAEIDLLIVENVGNLICPTHWALGEHLRVCLLGASEGHDKPIKYPDVFARADAIVLNKVDLIDLVGFERPAFEAAVRALNPGAPLFELSCRRGLGLAAWCDFLLARRAAIAEVAECA
jgi:hydrogenase nickel incorporation protein HypB